MRRWDVHTKIYENIAPPGCGVNFPLDFITCLTLINCGCFGVSLSQCVTIVCISLG